MFFRHHKLPNIPSIFCLFVFETLFANKANVWKRFWSLWWTCIGLQVRSWVRPCKAFLALFWMCVWMCAKVSNISPQFSIWTHEVTFSSIVCWYSTAFMLHWCHVRLQTCLEGSTSVLWCSYFQISLWVCGVLGLNCTTPPSLF